MVYEFDQLHLTALHWAVKRDHTRVAILLIELNSYVNAKDNYG